MHTSVTYNRFLHEVQEQTVNRLMKQVLQHKNKTYYTLTCVLFNYYLVEGREATSKHSLVSLCFKYICQKQRLGFKQMYE